MAVRTAQIPRAAFWTGLTGTALVHLTAVLALVLSVGKSAGPMPPSYRVELVAAAPATGRARTTPEAPAPAPPPPKSIDKAAPKPTKPAAKAPAKTPAARAASPVTPLPGETPKGGTDIANVNTQGKEFPYPEYLRNLVTQIYRRWNRPSGNAALEAEVTFVILRDGTVRDIKMLRTSRSYSFDQEAEGAIEAAALAKAFGPLPAGYPADYLPISFLFTPRQGQ
jgi:periplasmic protein TonB